MTQLSRFWDGILAGDATNAPYDADDKFAKVLQSLANADSDTNGGRVCRGVLNELACSGVASPIGIATGRAIVDGSWYENDAATTLVVTMDKGYVVLRKGTVAQTVRLAITEQNGGAYPALVQTRGTTWEYPLCSFVLAGGVVTITDMRTYTPYIPLVNPDFVKLGEVLLAAPDPSITFDITGLTYRLYVLVTTLKVNIPIAVFGSAKLDFNAGGVGEFDGIVFFADGLDVTPGATQEPGVDHAWISATTIGAPTNPEAFGPGIAFLFNLHSTSQWKQLLLWSGAKVTLGDVAQGISHFLWRNTAAVTLINITGNTADIAVGSRISLYGVA
jgi:hypothetical protein